MRGRMSDAPSYAAQVAIGAVMVGGTAGHLVGISQSLIQNFCLRIIVLRGGGSCV